MFGFYKNRNPITFCLKNGHGQLPDLFGNKCCRSASFCLPYLFQIPRGHNIGHEKEEFLGIFHIGRMCLVVMI